MDKINIRSRTSSLSFSMYHGVVHVVVDTIVVVHNVIDAVIVGVIIVLYDVGIGVIIVHIVVVVYDIAVGIEEEEDTKIEEKKKKKKRRYDRRKGRERIRRKRGAVFSFQKYKMAYQGIFENDILKKKWSCGIFINIFF